ncbi:MAG: type IX secretion system plug protein [Nitritalea sp.]
MLLISSFLFLLGGQPLQAQVLQNQVMEENIVSVRLFPRSAEFAAQMRPAVIPLRGSAPLRLSFDDLAYDPDMYSAKLIHCNADWTPSDLRDNDFLDQFNEFNLTDYQYAIDTRVPYVHYNFDIPPVTKSGNYIIRVYRGRDERQTILTQRFMVFDDQVKAGVEIVPPSQTAQRRMMQQLNIMLNYGAREVFDPRNAIQVVVRQNQRWDNAIYGLTPTMIRENQQTMEFRNFDGSNAFLAGNEFRFADLRFVRTRGANIARVAMEEDIVYAETVHEPVRRGQAYSQYLDMNGQYGIFTADRQNFDLESEYMLVTFNLKNEGVRDTPYVVGALTAWGTIDDAKMTLNKETNTWQTTLLLKQGWYDYQFAYKTAQGFVMSELEGDHFETENEYELFIYYRDMGSRYDELIGYTHVNPNRRRL